MSEFRLESCDGLNSMCFANSGGTGLRESEMQHLAFIDKLFHGTRNVLDWHIRINAMLIEESMRSVRRRFRHPSTIHLM